MDDHHTERFGNVPHTSENLGNVPQASATFGNVPNGAATFRIDQKASAKTEQHTLTVREVARLFESQGVSRTERSITNWCQMNRQGIARLDAFFDENEGRYYITPQSVSLAIDEEKAKQASIPKSESISSTIPKSAEAVSQETPSPKDEGHLRELEHRNRDLEITNRTKDMFIETLRTERNKDVEKLIGMSRYVGRLETQLLQLGGQTSSNVSLTDVPAPDFERNVSEDREGATGHQFTAGNQ